MIPCPSYGSFLPILQSRSRVIPFPVELSSEVSILTCIPYTTWFLKLTFISFFISRHFYLRGRHGGLVVSALDSGSRGAGSSPGRVIVLCSWARHFTLTVSLSTQEKCWGVTCDGLASHPGRIAIFLVA